MKNLKIFIIVLATWCFSSVKAMDSDESLGDFNSVFSCEDEHLITLDCGHFFRITGTEQFDLQQVQCPFCAKVLQEKQLCFEKIQNEVKLYRKCDCSDVNCEEYDKILVRLFDIIHPAALILPLAEIREHFDEYDEATTCLSFKQHCDAVRRLAARFHDVCFLFLEELHEVQINCGELTEKDTERFNVLKTCCLDLSEWLSTLAQGLQ